MYRIAWRFPFDSAFGSVSLFLSKFPSLSLSESAFGSVWSSLWTCQFQSPFA